MAPRSARQEIKALTNALVECTLSVELLIVLSSKPGCSRHAAARVVCNYVTEVLPSQPLSCPLAVGGLTRLNYSDLTSKQLGELRLRVVATVLQ